MILKIFTFNILKGKIKTLYNNSKIIGEIKKGVKFMKKVLTIVSSLIIAVSCTTVYCKTENASAICVKYEDGKVVSGNGNVIIPVTNVIKHVKESEEYLSLADGTKFEHIKSLPSDKEIKNLKSGIYYYVEDENLFYMITTEENNEPKETESEHHNQYFKKISIAVDDIEAKYIIDHINCTIADAVTGEIIKIYEKGDECVYRTYYEENHYVIDMISILDDIYPSPLCIPENVIEAKRGDIDSDEKVDLSDLTMLSQLLLRDIKSTDYQEIVADIDGNGEFDICDLALLKQYIMHDDVKLGVQK